VKIETEYSKREGGHVIEIGFDFFTAVTILASTVVLFGGDPTSRRKTSLPSSGLKGNPRYKQVLITCTVYLSTMNLEVL
jgi:hypothetical protein